MTQRLMMRDASPAAGGATALSPTETSSFEDKLMLLQLFDRIENTSAVPHPICKKSWKNIVDLIRINDFSAISIVTRIFTTI